VGGPGSGNRWRHDARATTDDHRSIDVRRLTRAGALRAGVSSRWQWTLEGETVDEMRLVSGPGYVTFSYRLSTPGKPWHSYRYPVAIDYMPCPLGGSRPWFLCP